ncbi:MAG TPA: hypothetical protein VGL38_12570 [bacterium]
MSGLVDRLRSGRGKLPRASGVSLLEMIIAMSLAMVLMASLFSLYYGAAHGIAKEENAMSADREGRLVVQHLTRDFRLVGLMALQDVNGDTNDIRRDVPYQAWSDSIRQDFEFANTYSVVFTADIDNDGRTETARYYLDPTAHILKQQTWVWSRDSVRWRTPTTRNIASHVDFLMFRYIDKDGLTIPNPIAYPAGGYTLTAGERVRITAVEITVVTKSEQAGDGRPEFVLMPDGTYWQDRFKRNIQRFLVRGRNLSLGA